VGAGYTTLFLLQALRDNHDEVGPTDFDKNP
jgi:hypothetical protein